MEERADQVRTWSGMPVGELNHQALRALGGAWERAAEREALRPPSRASFSPTDVVEALTRTTLLERVAAPAGAGHSWRYRLVGTEIVALLQADPTGDTIERYHRPLTAMLRQQFDAAVAAEAPLGFVVRTIVDHRPYVYEKIVLPLRSAPGAGVDQIVVASFPLGGP